MCIREVITNKGGLMAKLMAKWQIDHFETKVRDKITPQIEEQELLIRQYKADAVEKTVLSFSKKMGADKVIKQLEEAEKMLEIAMAKARTFFKSQAKTEDKKEALSYKFDTKGNYSYRDSDSNKITSDDCKEQVRTWCSKIADREIERRPEGKRLAELKQTLRLCKDKIMEAQAPVDLIEALNGVFKQSLGITWNEEVPKLEHKK
jgi:hypothetical protein